MKVYTFLYGIVKILKWDDLTSIIIFLVFVYWLDPHLANKQKLQINIHDKKTKPTKHSHFSFLSNCL